MSRINLRKRKLISYYEPEEPSLDEFIFCDECSDYVYEYCSLHGALYVVPDDKVSAKSTIPRAECSLPQVFLKIAPSTIQGAGLGVFAKLTLPKDVRFGPYIGNKTHDVDASRYSWQIYKDGKKTHSVDASDINKSNWMRYVNCARHWYEQNLIAYQYRSEIYYRTIRIIPRETELLVFYGSEFANLLGIDLKLYNKTRAIAMKDKKKAENEILKKQENLPSTSAGFNKNIEKTSTIKLPEKIVKPTKKSFIPPFKCDKLNINLKEKTTYICDICKEEYNEKINLIKHIDIHSKNNNKEDSILRRGKENLKVKIQTDRKEKPYKCNLCKFKTTQNSALKTHIRTHTGEKPYKCNLCNYKTAKNSDLISHIRTHTGEKPYKCNYKTAKNSNLISHIRTHTGEKPYKCNLCNYKTAKNSDLISHIRTHTGEKPYKCNLCNYKTAKNSNLISHIRTHTGEKPYKCNLCDYKATHNGHLTSHIRTHTGEKPYKCNLCNYKTAKNSDLISHIRTHTGEKPYKCNLCNYKTAKNSNLISHIRTHTGEKPYKCNLCDYKATHNGHLTSHIRTHTGEKPYKCNLCDYKTAINSNLKSHIRTHTGEKPYKCNLCDYKTTRNNALKSHIRTQHTNKKTQ